MALGAPVGAVLLISRNGRIGSHRAFGWQDREAQIPMSKTSIFRVLSMTKSITCASTMCLVDEGKLNLDDPVARYAPEFEKVRFADGRIPKSPPKLWQLMAHSAGLVDSYTADFLKTDFTLEDIVAFAARTPLGYEPGEGWAYSNGGLAILGRVIENVSGLRYPDFVRQKIFLPVGMSSSSFLLQERDRAQLVAIYRISDGQIERDTDDPINAHPNYVSPESGLHTTALDLWRFYEMIRNDGNAQGTQILSAKSAMAMRTVQTEDRNAGFLPGMGYGFGLSLVTKPNGIFANHSIGTFGHGSYYQTHGWVDPVKSISGLLFCQNRADSVVVTEEAVQFVKMLGTLD